MEEVKKTETAPPVTPPVETKPAETPPVAETPKPKPVPMVPVHAVHEVRAQNHALKAELQRLKSEIAKKQSDTLGTQEDDQVAQRLAALDERQIAMSIGLVQDVKEDAQEAFDRWDKELETNPDLYQNFIKSTNPGKFAYDWGKRLLSQDKYGSTPEEYAAAIRQEVESDLKEKIAKEVYEKFKASEAQPTNLSGARAAGGDVTPEARPKTAKEIWG